MTSTTPKTTNPQGQPAPAATSSPAATSPSTPSGPSSGSAAAPAARPSFAAALKKTTAFTPSVPNSTQASTSASTGPSQQPAAAAQNVRGNPSPVNGKTVPPAVPAVNGPANGQHSRKSSVATSSVGVGSGARNGGPYMPNRPQPATPSTIQFGSLNAGTPGSPALANAALAANSPQIAPAQVKTPGSGQHANIQFGSFPSEGNTSGQQRPAQMGGPPIAGQPGPVHTRRDSNTAEAPPVGLGPSRNSMPPNGARRNNHQGPGGYQNQYQPHNQYNYNANNAPYRGTPTQPRGGQHMGGGQYPPQGPPGTPMGGYNNRRSPAMPHASPMTTPQMATAQLAGNPQQMYQSYGPHMGGPPHTYMPQTGYEYAPPQYPYYPPHASPRPQYNQMPSPSPGYAPIYPQNQGQSMSRTPSVNTAADLHRPPSTIGVPPQQMVMGIPGPGTPVPGSPGPNKMYSRPAAKRSNAIEIKNPVTGEVVAPKVSSTPKTPDAPVIVSSSPAPGVRTPSHDRTFSRSSVEDQKKKEEEQKKREEVKAAFRRQLEERKKEEEERKRKEEEERLAKEKAEQEAKEAEEKAKKEEEERIEREKKEEEERVAKEAEEKAKKEEEERLKKEAEEKAKKEEEERLAKEAEEKSKKEEEDRIAKEKADKEAAEAKDKEDAEAKAKADAPAQPTIEISKEEGSTESKPETPSEEKMMPPPKQRGLKPAPISIPGTGTAEKPLATPALNSLRSARFIDDITKIDYPTNIMSPNPALNPNAMSSMGKFKYDKDFLMQFSVVFTEKPTIDWDQRIRDSVGEPSDSVRTPAGGRMPSRAASARGGLGGSMATAPMGAFVPSSTKTLGTTSAQRFAQSSGALGGFGMGAMGSGSFKGAPMSRTQSNTSLSGHNFTPASPKMGGRQQSTGGRSQSKRQNQNQNEGGNKTQSQLAAQGITIPLGEIKPLAPSATGWKPRTVGVAAAEKAPTTTEEDGRMAPEMVQRKVKAALNKMTPEKFDRIADQILDIASQSKFESDGRTLRQVIQLTFEKATDEAAWSSMYAKFCKRMLETMDPQIKDEGILDKAGNVVTGGALFRKYLLNRCQEEFERGWKVNLPPKPEGTMDEAAMLSDEYYIAAAAKRRGLGLIQFIGELFKLGMLTERIMHECVKKLVDFEGIPEEEEAESLVKLLRTIGGNLDSTAKSRPLMDVYFARIAKVMDMKGLNSRIRFMLLDLIELRKKGWETKEADKGPKTLAEIHEEAQRAQAEKDAKNAQSNQRRGGGGGGQRDPRSYSSGGYGMQGPQDWQQNQKQTLDMGDIKGLGSRLGKNRPGMMGAPQSFGPSGLLGARSSSGGGKKVGSAKGDDSGPNSRSATPQPSANRFGILGGGDGNDSTDAASPPTSTVSSPPVTKARISEIARQ